MSVGYIYVLSNPKMPRLLKIGFTCVSVERRCREISSATGVPHEFTIEYFRLTEDAEDAEETIHRELEAYRVNENREFFAVDIAVVIAAILRNTTTPPIRFQRAPVVSKEPTALKYSCRRCGAPKTAPGALCSACGF